MASVLLEDGYFHRSDDYSDFVAIPVNAIGSVEARSQGGVVVGVTGRHRILTRPGLGGSYQFTFNMISYPDLNWFRINTNRELYYRGPRGRAFFGFIPALSLNDTPGPTDVTRALTFTMDEITKEVGVSVTV